MAQNDETKTGMKKFAGIEVPPDLTKGNFFFLYFNTLIAGMLLGFPAIVQPAFLSEIIKINQDFAGSINGLLQNMSQIATLLLVALVGVLSDKVGRKILAFFGFLIVGGFFYFLSFANGVAAGLHIPAGLSSQICALLSFMPSRAAEFGEFAPGLLITYITRLIIGVGFILTYPQFITMVADYTYEKDRGKGMAMNGVMMGVSSLLVFAIFAPIQKQAGVVTTLYIIGFIALAGAVCTWVFLKDHLPETKAAKPSFKDIIPVVRKSLPLKASYLCALITRADIIVLATFLMSWGVKYGKEIEMTAETATLRASIPMMVMGVLSMVCFPIVGIMLDKWGRVPVIILATSGSAAGMILLFFCPNPFSPLVYPAAVLCAFGMAGAIAGANTLATDVSPKAMVGSIMGGLNTMQPIGVLFFLGVGGYLFDVLGPGWAFLLKGAASAILFIWLLAVKNSITSELKETATK